MKAIFRNIVPAPIWRRMSLAKYRVMEAIKPPPLVPPEHLNLSAAADSWKSATSSGRFFRDLGGLKRNDRVLDVGCGIGRMAGPLTAYLSRKGSYEGFDIVPHGIEWCTANITRRFPRFRFQLADIRNKWYNANGRTGAAGIPVSVSRRVFRFRVPGKRIHPPAAERSRKLPRRNFARAETGRHLLRHMVHTQRGIGTADRRGALHAQFQDSDRRRTHGQRRGARGNRGVPAGRGGRTLCKKTGSTSRRPFISARGAAGPST